jgi:hypothetical protein
LGGCAASNSGSGPTAASLPAGETCGSIKSQLNRLDAKGVQAYVQAQERARSSRVRRRRMPTTTIVCSTSTLAHAATCDGLSATFLIWRTVAASVRSDYGSVQVRVSAHGVHGAVTLV